MSEDRTTSTMQDERPSEVLGSLPRSRPHRRSEKRSGAREAQSSAVAATDAPKAEPDRKPAPAQKVTATPKPAPSKGNATAKPPRTARASTAGAGKATTAAKPRSASRRSTTTLRQPPQPGGVPPQPDAADTGARDHSPDIVRTAVQAAAELAEMGLSASARALRQAVSRLPRP